MTHGTELKEALIESLQLDYSILAEARNDPPNPVADQEVIEAVEKAKRERAEARAQLGRVMRALAKANDATARLILYTMFQHGQPVSYVPFERG